MAKPVNPNSTGRLATIVLFAFTGTLVVLAAWRIISGFPNFSFPESLLGKHATTSSSSPRPSVSPSATAPTPTPAPELSGSGHFGADGGVPVKTAKASVAAKKKPSRSPMRTSVVAFPVQSGSLTASSSSTSISSGPSVAPTPTPTPSVTPTPPAAPVFPALNTADSPVRIGTQTFAATVGTPGATTVSISGFTVPVTSGLVADGGVLDWGDGSAATTTATATTMYSHAYATTGSYSITWKPSLTLVPAPTTSQTWTDDIILPAGAIAVPPADGLAVTEVGLTATFAVTGTTTWNEWTLDYGDGTTAATGNAASLPSAAQLTHTYAAPGSVAVLTAIGPDGQVTTSSVPIT